MLSPQGSRQLSDVTHTLELYGVRDRCTGPMMSPAKSMGWLNEFPQALMGDTDESGLRTIGLARTGGHSAVNAVPAAVEELEELIGHLRRHFNS